MKVKFLVQINRHGEWIYLTEFDTKSEAESFVSQFENEAVLRVKNHTSY